MQFSLPFEHSRPGTMAGFANDNSSPGLGTAPKGTAGLALSCEMEGEGQPIAVIRPVLADGQLGVPLHVARDGSDIIALWRRFGQMMNLPLFVVTAEGQLDAFSTGMGEISYPRRGGSPLSRRRTRFARRRQLPLIQPQPSQPGASPGREKRR